MNTIWKYPLPIQELISLRMPIGAKILTIQLQGRIVCLWAIVDPIAVKEERFFEMFDTGQKIPCNSGIARKYISTIMKDEGRFVFHVFERINQEEPDKLK